MNIAILGYGIEGESVYRYYRAKFPDAMITAYDNHEQPKNPLPHDVKFVGGVKDFKGITADLAIKTPAIAPWLVEVSGEVTTATREFMQQCPAPIIGVTGSKGKGTTSSLIKSILDAAGKKTWLVGNIGVGSLDVLRDIKPEDIVIYELSSFQLWDLDVSPDIAVILAIEPEHLDVHKDFEDYLNAKANIRNHQSPLDYCFYHPTNKYSEQIAVHPTFDREGNWVDDWREVNDWNWNAFKYNTVNVRDDSIWIARYEVDGFYISKGTETNIKLCDFEVLKIHGDHNKENATAAISAAMVYTDNFDAIKKGLGDFAGLPHRLQFVKTVGTVSYYDDSIATTPSAAIAALRSFEGSKVIILGGSSKGSDFTELGVELTNHDAKAILIGDEAANIAASCDHAGFKDYEIIEDSTMDDIVKRAAELAKPHSTVLLSPASASFGLFKNYADRGDQFSRAVSELN